MLVLTRKVTQQIRLGDDITITVLRVQGNSIRIGVDAPRSVRVLRGELEPHEAVEAVEAKTLEFDLQDLLDGSSPEAEAEADAGNRSAAEPQAFSLRSGAPLAGFVRSSEGGSLASLSLH